MSQYFGFAPAGTQYSITAQPSVYSAVPSVQVPSTYVQPVSLPPQAPYSAVASISSAHPTFDSVSAAAYQTVQQPNAYAAYATGVAAVRSAAPSHPPACQSYQAFYRAASTQPSTYTYSAPHPAAVAVAKRDTTKAYIVAPATNYNNLTQVSSSSTSQQQGSAVPAYQSGYAAALYSAASSYYQQKQHVTVQGVNKIVPGVQRGGHVQQFNVGQRKPFTQRGSSRDQELHYCEVCKISCAGPQTYKEHLEGQKHKKKEIAVKQSATTSYRPGQKQLRCELCDVTCTGVDAYAAHIRGVKHQKTVKLHQRLGKPIPSADPVVLKKTSSSTTSASTVTSSSCTVIGPSIPSKPADTISSVPTVVKKVVATPKISFLGGSTLKSIGGRVVEEKVVSAVITDGSAPASSASSTVVTARPDSGLTEEEHVNLMSLCDKDVVPVGYEYIEEQRSDGKTLQFNCKLCDCKFSDPNAKEMHLKGRRHRLQYKKKVDPQLEVDIKPSIRARRIQEERVRRQMSKEDFWRRRDMEERMREMQMLEWANYAGQAMRLGNAGMNSGRHLGGMRRSESVDDRHVMAKHASIYPTEAELQAVQRIVSATEKALRLVSDDIADEDTAAVKLKWESEQSSNTVNAASGEDGNSNSAVQSLSIAAATAAPIPQRALKGVMRVGVLAKGLLLHGDLQVELVLLCLEKPTRTFLERVFKLFSHHLASMSVSVVKEESHEDNTEEDASSAGGNDSTNVEESYIAKILPELAGFVVSSNGDPITTCTVTLTCPVLRDSCSAAFTAGEASRNEPTDLLDKVRCLEALAQLRHTKWFQAKANGLQACVVVIRILRDLCQRVPTWAPLSEWAMELLVEKCISSDVTSMTPGDALRRVFECVASGIILPTGPGIHDPCEKDLTDAAGDLSSQEREDITASAQHALRLIAFRQIHKVLDMEPLPTLNLGPKKQLKRRRSDVDETGVDETGGEKKKASADQATLNDN